MSAMALCLTGCLTYTAIESRSYRKKSTYLALTGTELGAAALAAIPEGAFGLTNYPARAGCWLAVVVGADLLVAGLIYLGRSESDDETSGYHAPRHSDAPKPDPHHERDAYQAAKGPCDQGNPNACVTVAAYAQKQNHDATEIDRALRVACEGRIAEACVDLSVRAPTRTAAQPWLRRACDLDHAHACAQLANSEAEPSRRLPLDLRACELGDDASCFHRVRVEPEVAKQIAILDLVCKRRVEMCAQAATIARDYDQNAARRFHLRACNAHRAEGCEVYSAAEWNTGMEAACEQGDADACFALKDTGTEVERRSAIERACKARHAQACKVIQDEAAETRWRAQTQVECDRGSGQACFALRKTGTPAERRAVLERACKLKHAPACEALGAILSAPR